MTKKHRFIWWLLRPLVRVFLFFKLGYRCKMAKGLPEKYIVLSNHNTDWDPVLVGASFRRQMYFVGSEHISRWGFVYKLLKWAFDPIMRPKGTSAASAILDILRRVRKGANVCMFAEGVRSWDGRPSPIADTTGQLVKSAKCALVTYRIVGGYFKSPAWSGSGMRRGHLRGAPVAVYSAEELSTMSVDEINAILRRDLYEDAYERQEREPHRYCGKDLAVGLEILAPDCPVCAARNAMRTEGNRYFCSECGASAIYTEYGMLEGLEGIKTVRELSDRQRAVIAEDARTGVKYTADGVSLYRVERHEETLISEGTMTLEGDTLTIGNTTFSVAEMDDLAIHGRYALVFSRGKEYYEVELTHDVGTGINKLIHYYRERRALAKTAPMREMTV